MQSPLVFLAAYRQQLVKFPFLPQQEVWKGHTGDSELANKAACQLTHFKPTVMHFDQTGRRVFLFFFIMCQFVV